MRPTLLQRLLTFPDAHGRRWSVFGPFWRAQPRWIRAVFLIAIGLWVLSQTVRLGVVAFVGLVWMEAPEFQSIPDEVARAQRDVLTHGISYLAFLLGVGVYFLLLLRLIAPAEVRRLIRKHRCPSCGYALADLPSAPTILCPECGAAWNTPVGPAPPPPVFRLLTFPDAAGHRWRASLPRKVGGRLPLRSWTGLMFMETYIVNFAWLAGLCFALYFVCRTYASRPSAVDPDRFIRLLPPLLLTGAAVPFLHLGLTRVFAPVIARILLKSDLCPTCGSLLPRSAAPSTVCSKCGGTWRRPDSR